MQMRKDMAPAWLRYLVVAAGYALSFELLHSISFSHWLLLTSLRISCLLVVPSRYWPALLIGELIPLGYENYQCLNEFGLSWVLLASLPSIGAMMPIVWGLREQLPGPGKPTVARIGPFLFCGFIVSLIVALRGIALYSIGPLSPGEQAVPLADLASRYFLGAYLPIVVFVPSALAIYEWHPSSAAFAQLAAKWALLLECAALLVVVCVMVGIGMKTTDVSLRHVMQFALFLPVAAFALRHGWRGAAMTGALASVGIVLIMPTKYEDATMMAQTLMAFAMTTFLMLGAMVSSLRHALHDSWQSLRMARQELYLQELRRRDSALELERVHSTLRQTHNGLMQRLRFFLPSAEGQTYNDKLATAQQQLHRVADSLSPSEWQQSIGHPHALQYGPIADVLEAAGVIYDADLRGQLSQLASDLRITLYRVACEAVIHLMAHAPTDQVTLRTKTRIQASRIEVELEIASCGSPISAPSKAWLLSGLGATGLSERDMRHQATIFQGDLRIERASPMRIVVKLYDDTSGFGYEPTGTSAPN